MAMGIGRIACDPEARSDPYSDSANASGTQRPPVDVPRRLAGSPSAWRFAIIASLTRAAPWIALVCGTIAIVRMAMTIPVFNNIVDEPFHIGAAVALYDMRKHVYGVEHPPLPRLVAGLPLYLSGVHLPQRWRTRTIANEPQSCEAGAAVLFDNGQLPYRQTLHRARYAMLIFPAMLLLCVYLLARWLAGAMVAAASVAFLSLDPTLLGHGALVCTDVAAATGFVAALYFGARWIMLGGAARAAVAGIAIAAALACKFTSAQVIPVLVGLALWQRLGTRRSAMPIRLGQILIASVLGVITLWATYLFDVGPIGDQNRFPPDSEWRLIPSWVKQMPVPMPSLAIGGLWFAQHARNGHPAYLNGQLQQKGWWYYFPEAIALKSPLGLLVAMGFALAAVAARRRARLPARRAAPVLLAAAILLAGSLTARVNIGIRHVLPLIVMLYLLACWPLVRGRLLGALAGCLTLAAAETAIAHPDYLSFFNLGAGGTQRGDRFLADSNIDWGQDIDRLAKWLHSPEMRGRPYALHLFMYPKDKLPRELGLDPAAVDAPPPPAGLFAISTNIGRRLFGFELRKDGTRIDAPDYSWLDRYRVIKRIGSSIRVYDLAQPLDEKLAAQR
ncbi:hypothetical protein [Fontivita pretiosa]|uniref:hypothetical protein n=1 Tax=Fontivita pretiosa TaxID=2989684 RepID=UPI003D167F51